MIFVRLAQRWLGNQGLNPHDLNEAASSLTADTPIVFAQFMTEFSLTIKRPLRVDFIEIFHDEFVLFVHLCFAGFETVAIYFQKLALAAHRNVRVIFFNHGLLLRSIPSRSHFFSRNFFAMTSSPTLRSSRAVSFSYSLPLHQRRSYARRFRSCALRVLSSMHSPGWMRCRCLFRSVRSFAHLWGLP